MIVNYYGFSSDFSCDFIECIASKEGAETGRFIDGTPFNNYDIKQMTKTTTDNNKQQKH